MVIDGYTIYEYRTYDNYIRYGVRNSGGYPVYSAWTQADCIEAVRRKIETGDFARQPTEEELQAYMQNFAKRLDEDAKLGFTRD